MSDKIKVTYQGYLLGTRIPFRYLVTLYVSGIPTGISQVVWLRRRAEEAMHAMIHNGNELVHQYGVATDIVAELYAQQREEAMAKVKVGDSVKLLVDIGQYKKGRVCKVAEVAEPSFYEARGGTEWSDDRYPIKVIPVRAATDSATLGPRDLIPLARGEFGPVTEETADD